MAFADRVYGLLQTGRVTEAYLLDLLPRIAAPVTEIYCHPDLALAGEPRNGPPGAGPQELAAVSSARVRRQVEESGFTLSAAPQTTKTAPPAPRTAPQAIKTAERTL